MELENPLWNFALKFYSQPGVEQACLSLQDRFGCSINRLIFACWAGQAGIVLTPDVFFAEPAAGWQSGITHPLRQLRFQVRNQRQKDSALEPCYRALRQAELACEQVELALLYDLAVELPQAQVSGRLMESNLQGYLTRLNLKDAQVSPLIAVLKAAAPIAYQSTGLVSG